MSKLSLVVVTAFTSATACWLLFAAIFSPDDHDFLVETTSYYFKTMSEMGKAQYASYSDCRLSESDSGEKLQGIVKYGICHAEDAKTTYYYAIAMGQMGKYLFSDFEQTARK